MKPCSAYCQPEEGRHTFLDYCDSEESARDSVWTEGTIWPDEQERSCLPEGTEFRVLQVRPAVEAPSTPDERFPFAMLLTVEVLS